MSREVEQIKERLGIVDVVSSYIQLEQRGRQFVARCPFHQERTGSFYVSPERNTYHCFGCGKGGDIFSFVQDIEGSSFREALSLLASKAGIVLSNSYDKEISDSNTNVYDLMEKAKNFYKESINDEVKNYLKERGLTEDTINKFDIGFAKDDWRLLTTFFSGIFSQKEITASGLFMETPKGIYDKFRGRIMFPIKDSQGRVVAFTGRILPSLVVENKTVGKEPAKYVNSPETDLYHKSSILFGYDIAKNHIRLKKRVILVEGQMDLISLHQAGFCETVALSGTALTETHLKLIGRFTDKIIFSLDNDEAGLKATERGIKLALSKGFDVYMSVIFEGKDPADVLLENPRSLDDVYENPKHVVIGLMDLMRKESKDDMRLFRSLVESRVLPFVALIPKNIDRAHFVNVIARAIDLSDDVVFQSLKTLTNVDTKEIKEEKIPDKIFDEQKLLRGIIFWSRELVQNNKTVSENRIDELLKKYINISLDEFLQIEESEKEILISEAEFHFRGNVDILDKSATELTLVYCQKILKAKMESLRTILKIDDNIEILNEYQKIKTLSESIQNERNIL